MVPPANAAPAGRRLVELDVLRAAAMGLVLVNHAYMMRAPGSWPGWFHKLFAGGVRGGWVGVDLFFVLSGFLVSGLLFREYRALGTLTAPRFYARRAWKIYPAFVAMLAGTVAALTAAHGPPPAANVLSEACFLQSYLPPVWLHTWSLAVEEHFYLMLPLVLALLARRKPGAADPFAGRLPALVVAVMAASCAARMLHAELDPTASPTVRMTRTHFRLDGLFLGVLIGYVAHFHRDALARRARPVRWLLVAAGLAALVPPFVWLHTSVPGLTTWGLSVNALAGGAVLVGLLHVALPSVWPVTLAACLGRASYAIYLWHIPWVLLGLPQLERLTGDLGFAPRVAVYVAGSVGLGVVMTWAVEGPALRLRERLSPSLSTPRG